MNDAAVIDRRRREHRRRRGASAPPTSGPGVALDLLRSAVFDLGPGAPLVEVDLITELGASRNSVRAALRALAEEGVVERRTRVGTTVAELPVRGPAPVAGPELGAVAAVRRSNTLEVPAPPRLARLLGVDPGTSVVRSESLLTTTAGAAVEVTYGVAGGRGHHVSRGPWAPVRWMPARTDRETARWLGLAEGEPTTWVELRGPGPIPSLRHLRIALGEVGSADPPSTSGHHLHVGSLAHRSQPWSTAAPRSAP